MIVDFVIGDMLVDFLVGLVIFYNVDFLEEDLIMFDMILVKWCEFDVVVWIGDDYFVIVNEGDYEDV